MLVFAGFRRPFASLRFIWLHFASASIKARTIWQYTLGCRRFATAADESGRLSTAGVSAPAVAGGPDRPPVYSLPRNPWYNPGMRYTPLALAVAILCTLTGCEPKAIDPDTGREMSAPEWAARTERVKRQADADIAAAIASAKRESDRMASEAAAAEQTAAANAAKAKRAFERAVARLQTETALKVDDLAAEFDAAQADAALSLRATLDAFAARTAEIQAQADDRIATNRLAVEATNAKAQAALDQIAAKQERLASFLSVGQSVAGSFGPGGAAIAGLLGVAGGLFGIGQRNKAKQTEEAATRVVDAIEVLKEKNPVFAQAFKQHAKTLSDWMGPAGVALVNKAQNA